MAEEEKTLSTRKHPFRDWLVVGCVVPLIVFCALIVITVIWWFWPVVYDSSEPDFIRKAVPRVERQQDEIRGKISAGKMEYDIDQTITALFSIEKALTEAKGFDDFSQFILRKDSDLVAPDVRELKYRFFNIYKRLLDAKDEMDEMKSVYNVAGGALLDIVSTVDFPVANISRAQAVKVWDKRFSDAKLRRGLEERLRKSQDAMIEFYFDYARISANYYREWDKLCALRDRAYLAVYERDWEEAVNCASKAVELAPREREAHILLCMALMERGLEADLPVANTILTGVLENTQGQNAPAYLLRGVANLKQGKFDQATLDFDQAATYYPKQKDLLLDNLNLYKKRQFLNNSKEGRMIINIYRGVMTGSGYFSPDFQKARVLLARNQNDKAKRKIFDHFFRRRLQGQWDRVLMDFKYSENYLKTDLYEIFAGDKIKLEIDSAMFTNSVIVTIENKGDFDIHNMTILLCVRFTDMFKGDHISFPVGETVAVLKKGESITVGRRNLNDVTKEKLGEVKTFSDIIEYAAVLISDEAITWVEPVAVGELKASVDNNSKTIPEETTEKDSGDVGSKLGFGKDKVKKVLKKVVDSTIDMIYEKTDERLGSSEPSN